MPPPQNPLLALTATQFLMQAQLAAYWQLLSPLLQKDGESEPEVLQRYMALVNQHCESLLLTVGDKNIALHDALKAEMERMFRRPPAA